MAIKFDGQVKFFDHKKGYGIIVTNQGDVFVHKSCVDSVLLPLMEAKAKVQGEYIKTYDSKTQSFRMSVVGIEGVVAPPPLVGLGQLGVPKKNGEYAFVTMLDGVCAGEVAFLHVTTAEAAGFTLAEGMPVRATLTERGDGRYTVVSFESGEEILTAVMKLLASPSSESLKRRKLKPRNRPGEGVGCSGSETALAHALRQAGAGLSVVGGTDTDDLNVA
jgi:cold shock CspA family protein